MCHSLAWLPKGKTASTGMTILISFSISHCRMIPMRKCSGVISMTASTPPFCPMPSTLGGGTRIRALSMMSTRGPGSSRRKVPSRLIRTPPSMVPMRMPIPKAQLSILGSQRTAPVGPGALSRCGWPPLALSHSSAGTLAFGPVICVRR